MRLGKDLIGKTIFSLDRGEKVGKVKDVYIDRGIENMAGLYLHREGVVRRREKLILYADVVVIGVDSILVRHGDAVTDSGEVDISDWMKITELTGR